MIKTPKFDVEHTISMYADGFVILPASQIYNKDFISSKMHIINKCHIYMIGYMPRLFIESFSQQDRLLVCTQKVGTEIFSRSIGIPDGFNLHEEGDVWFLGDNTGTRIAPNMHALFADKITFKVEYIGQSYGKDANRNALARLLKHETLQRISLEGAPSDCQLYVLLIELVAANRNMTVFHPKASSPSFSKERIDAGTRKLFETTEKERVSLFEAAFIRYFRPRFNVEFKNSFPSTNLKILSECYDKDFQAVCAEICIDEMHFSLFSNAVAASPFHIALFNLHTEADRQQFFN